MSQISTRSLINLSHRVGTSLRAGVDARRVWELETRHASGPLRERLETIRQRVAAGEHVADAMRQTGGYFPPMFVQMVEVGEATGKLDEVLLRLAEHYEHQQQMKRAFWFGVAWPLFGLTFAVFVIGAVILITGQIAATRGTEAIDILGWGLTGTLGAIVWFLGCGLVAAGIALALFALFRGWFGPGPVLAAMRVPVLGKCLEALALSRLTWSLAMSLDSGMDARRAVEMSISAAQNPYYEAGMATATGGIRANKQFHESFRDAGVFPTEFVNSLEAAEMAGATSESLLRLAKEYDERARTAMKILTGISTVAVMFVYFGLMIYFIGTLFYQAYYKPIQEALEMTQPGRM
jgi:type II secretory pathway component PulF